MILSVTTFLILFVTTDKRDLPGGVLLPSYMMGETDRNEEVIKIQETPNIGLENISLKTSKPVDLDPDLDSYSHSMFI